MASYINIQLLKAAVGLCAILCMYYKSAATVRSIAHLTSHAKEGAGDDTAVDAAVVEKYKDL
jgi:hypothetical protein